MREGPRHASDMRRHKNLVLFSSGPTLDDYRAIYVPKDESTFFVGVLSPRPGFQPGKSERVTHPWVIQDTHNPPSSLINGDCLQKSSYSCNTFSTRLMI